MTDSHARSSADSLELKPCPFCGGKATIQKRMDEDLWTHNIVQWVGVHCDECGIYFEQPETSDTTAAGDWNKRAYEIERERASITDDAQPEQEPVAWRYTCADGSIVLMLKRLTDEQKRRGYYTSEDGEDEVDDDEAVVGPFHWAEETPLYAAQPPAAPVENTDHIDWDAMAEERLGQRPPGSSADSAIADALERCDWANVSIGNKAVIRAAVVALRAQPQEVKVTDEMVTAAMRAFEPMSSVLRYREKDKWHSCDIMGMRDALKAALALTRPEHS